MHLLVDVATFLLVRQYSCPLSITLEMTLIGSLLDAITTKATYPFLRLLWNKASFDFAASAEGAVNVFQSTSRGVRLESVWRQVEYPQLMKQGNQIIYPNAP